MQISEVADIMENGYARLTIVIDLPDSPLAEQYRRMLGAPPDALEYDEMPIPENKTVDGCVTPVKQEFYRSIKQEQRSSLGFAVWILDSNMVPRSEQNKCRVSVHASAVPQIVSVTDAGLDGIWEMVVGPRDDEAVKAAAGSFLTKVAFAKSMLESLGGDRLYEISRSTKIHVPAGATLLNGNELQGLSWTVDFGGGTFVSASVSVNSDSAVVLNESTIITGQNLTASPAEVFQAFRSHGSFKIVYLLPGSAGSDFLLTGVEGDWHCNWNWKWSHTFTVSRSYEVGTSKLSAKLTITPSIGFSGYVGWDFHWWGEVNWFEAWIGASASISLQLDLTASGELSTSWGENLFDQTLHTFEFAIDYVPVWINFDLSLASTLKISAKVDVVTFTIGANVGGSFKGGVEYKHDDWHTIKESSGEASLTGLERRDIRTPLSASIESSMTFRISFMFYGVAGPYVELKPYATGSCRYSDVDEVGTWNGAVGMKLSAGLELAGWLKKLLWGLSGFGATLFDWKIKTWNGHWGNAPTLITINVAPKERYVGGSAWVGGVISSRYSGDKSGTVYIEVCTDDVNWSPAGATFADAGGNYSHSLVLWEPGIYKVRARWDGKPDLFKGATSANVTFKVSSVVTGSQELKHDDDDGDWPFDSRAYPTGYAVRFTAPTPSWVLQTIKVFGCYAEDRADAEFHVKIYDSDMNVLASFTEPYMVYFKKWPTIVWAPINLADILTYNIIVTGDFYIAVTGDARSAQDGDYAFFVVLDTDWYPNGNRSYTVDMESNSIVSGPYAMTSYMIRAVGISLVESNDFHGDHPIYAPDRISLSRERVDAHVKLRVDLLETGYYWFEWRWYSPDGEVFRDVLNGYFSDGVHWNGEDEDWISPITDRAFFEQYLERPFKFEIYLLRSNVSKAGAKLLVTETFYVTKSPTEVRLSVKGSAEEGLLLGNWTSYGKYLHLTSLLTSQSSLSHAEGNITVQYSTDRIQWINISSEYFDYVGGLLNYFECDWAPHAGMYYLRSIYEPTYDAALYYYGNTSDLTFVVQNETGYYDTFRGPVYSELTVYRTWAYDTTTDLSTDSMLYGSNVTITTSIRAWASSPAISTDGKNVTIKYGFENDRYPYPPLESYPLYTGTTNASGQFSFSWTPDTGVYYLWSEWVGDSDLWQGLSVPIQQLTVGEGRLTLVEIVKGANAEIDRASSDNLEFEVKVKDHLSGNYLNNTGTVEFYVSDQARYNIIYAGVDNDSNADGLYHLRWNASDWPSLGPQHWSAYFTGTSEYMPSLASTTLTIYQAGTEFWINPTFQTINISSSQEYTINLKWNQTGQDTFDLSISGLNPDWCTLSKTSITLSIKGKTEQATLNVSLPEDPAIQDDYDFMITATSQTDPSFSVSANATVHIPSLHDLQGTLIRAEILFDLTVQPLNLLSKCEFLAAHIEISNGKTGNYSLSDIEPSSIVLNSTFGIDPNEPTQIGDYDNDTIPDLSVQFNRSRIQQFILSANVKFGNVSLNITGGFKDGTGFGGKAILKVKMPSDTNMDGIVDLSDAILASWAFGSCAGSQDWNSSCDENEDGQVDIIDLILLAKDFGNDYT